MIQFLHVTKTYEDNWKALCDVTLRINQGEFVFLTGHSGAGKSTLLKLIYMDERPDEFHGGEVMVQFNKDLVFDTKTATEKQVQELRRHMGIVFQDFKLLPDRNVFENVALALRITGTPEKQLNSRVFDALALVGISQKRLAMPYTLSGGERRKLEIARALVRRPSVLMLDEPFAGVDPLAVHDIQEIVRNLRKQGLGVVITDHNVRETLNVVDRAYLVYNGRLLCEGTSEHLVNDEEARRLYLGENFRM